jgi:hypothetical protein
MVPSHNELPDTEKGSYLTVAVASEAR